MSTELLTQAADKLERILAGCTPGPWRRGGYGNYGPTVSADLPGPPYAADAFGVETYDSERGRFDAEFLETMNPIVGQALLALFRQLAWMGSMDPDQLHRVGVDEALLLAQAILDQHEAT